MEREVPGEPGGVDARTAILPGGRSDWPRHPLRLGWWRQQVDFAQERYRQGHLEARGVLYDYWRLIAEDVREQARVACETYRQLNFCPST